MIPPSTSTSINEIRAPRERELRDPTEAADRVALQGAFHALVEPPVEPPATDTPRVLSPTDQLPTDSDSSLDHFPAGASHDFTPVDSFAGGDTQFDSISESWNLLDEVENSPGQGTEDTVTKELSATRLEESDRPSVAIATEEQTSPPVEGDSPINESTSGGSQPLDEIGAAVGDDDDSQPHLDEAPTSTDASTDRDPNGDKSTDDSLDLAGDTPDSDVLPTRGATENGQESGTSFVTLTELNRADGESLSSLSSPTAADSTRGTPGTQNEAEFAKSNVTGYSVELESESAGKVMIRVQDSADGIRARLVTASETGYRMLENEMHNVRQVVEQSGIGLAEFSLGRRDGETEQGGFERQQLPAANTSASESTIEDPSPRSRPTTNSTGLDVWA